MDEEGLPKHYPNPTVENINQQINALLVMASEENMGPAEIWAQSLKDSIHWFARQGDEKIAEFQLFTFNAGAYASRLALENEALRRALTDITSRTSERQNGRHDVDKGSGPRFTQAIIAAKKLLEKKPDAP